MASDVTKLPRQQLRSTNEHSLSYECHKERTNGTQTTASSVAAFSIAAGITQPFPSAQAQQPAKKPTSLHHGDDIGIMQPSIYHRGLMVGETPNIDRIGSEGALFTHYLPSKAAPPAAMPSHRMHPLRTGMIPPQLPRSPSYLRPGTPAIAKFLLDLGYNTGEFGKNHLGDHTDALPDSSWLPGILGLPVSSRRDAGVSFPDINKTPTQQTVAPPCREHADPGSHGSAGCCGSKSKRFA